jgi:hypothetical protein
MPLIKLLSVWGQFILSKGQFICPEICLGGNLFCPEILSSDKYFVKRTRRGKLQTVVLLAAFQPDAVHTHSLPQGALQDWILITS